MIEMKFILLVAVLCIIANSVPPVKCDDKEDAKYAEADFFSSHFYRLKKKYDEICNKHGKQIVISFETTFTLIQTCLVPEMDKLKKELNKASEADPSINQEISDAIYPDHWNAVIDKCFRGKVQNFCYRSQEGKVERDPHNQTIDQALLCGGSKSYAFLSNLKAMYAKHAATVKSVATREQKCIDDFFNNVEANDGKYVPK